MTNSPARILVVDDEKLIRWSVGERLQRGGYEVLTAESGEEALEVLAAQSPDLVLLDVRLPGIDGLVTLQRALATTAAEPRIGTHPPGSVNGGPQGAPRAPPRPPGGTLRPL